MPTRLPTRSPRWYPLVAFMTVAAAWIASMGALRLVRGLRGLGQYEGLHLER